MTDAEIQAAEIELRALLKRFTYRPHWRFEVNAGFMIVTMLTADADNPGKDIVLTFTQAIPRYAFMRDFDWTRWLFEQVRIMEHHELQEFFRIDGRPVYEPHPELMERKHEEVANSKPQTATEVARSQYARRGYPSSV